MASNKKIQNKRRRTINKKKSDNSTSESNQTNSFIRNKNKNDERQIRERNRQLDFFRLYKYHNRITI